jgi:uncharacterized membrane protein YhiD involved in acid resistance
MEQELQQAWDTILGSVSLHQGVSAVTVGIHMLLAGAIGLYLRFLYRHYSVSASASDSITRVFPLLIVITTGVIGIVKTSVALSLGFLGSLSLIRFRSIIKEPEELVYLFLCVAVGLAIGAGLPFLAIMLVIAASILALILQYQTRKSPAHNMILTITGNANGEFMDGDSNVFSTLSELAGPYTLQRADLENGRGQVRIILRRSDPRHTAKLINHLKQRLPDCDFSYVNLESLR